MGCGLYLGTHQLIQWHGRSGAEAEISAYFTSEELWALGADGIIWEIQQVYKNFIEALDAYLPEQRSVGRTAPEVMKIIRL